MSQTWTIKGKTYKRGQLDEMRRQKLDPKTDEIVMKEITPRKKAKAAPEKAEEVKDVEIPAEVAGDTSEKPELPSNLMQLKKVAKEKGMTVTKTTKKDEILAFLKQ